MSAIITHSRRSMVLCVEGVARLDAGLEALAVLHLIVRSDGQGSESAPVAGSADYAVVLASQNARPISTLPKDVGSVPLVPFRA
jgi:hypothetical protein